MRRWALLAAVLAALLLILLAVRYAGVAGAGPLESRWDVWLLGAAGTRRGALRGVVRLGDAPFMIAATCALAAASVALRRHRLAIVALVGPGLTLLTTTVLQPVIGRTVNGGYALPSGHTAGITAVLTVGSLLVIGLPGGRRGGILAAVTVALGTLAGGATMGVALIANGLHVLTDTIAGFCAAVAIVLGTALSVDALGRHTGRVDR